MRFTFILDSMVPQPTKQFEQCQRLQVTRENAGEIKIVLERYDACLGWYPAGALTLPIHQLPLLQQALEGLDYPVCHADCDGRQCPEKIICFPTLLAGTSTQKGDDSKASLA